MVHIPAHDRSLASLEGQILFPAGSRGVSYRLGQAVGEGGMCVAFFAMRLAPEGQSPVVVKIVRPAFVLSSPHAALIVQKEAVALGRLNERVPPTPFVVRLIDAGNLEVDHDGRRLELPWLAVEYVHGGTEGTTLTDRVKYSLQSTGFAFDTERSARAVDCLVRALTVVHEVGVIHRDMKPDNVLCCGFGDDEIFKVVDFGVARPSGLAGTFKGELAGTPGYAAPEIQSTDPSDVGPWTDVFSVAPIVFYLLTGEEYFPADTPLEHILCVGNPHRRSILESPSLSPELRGREDACRAIDAELARATAVKPERRPHSADAFGTAILRWLHGESRQATTSSQRIETLSRVAPSARAAPAWSWGVRHHPVPGRQIRAVAWDGDGRCLAVTDGGLALWNGTTWLDAPSEHIPDPGGVRFAHRTAPGCWMIGGDGATLCSYSADAAGAVVRGSDPSLSYRLFSGTVDDLGVVVGSAPNSPPILHALVGGWWLKPLPLVDLARVTGLARIDKARWLVVGEGTRGDGYAGLYSPLDWMVERLSTRSASTFTGCAGQAERHAGVGVGSGGTAVLCQGTDAWLERVTGAWDLSAVGMDATGRIWAGGSGGLVRREPAACGAGTWEIAWEEASWRAPIVSILADMGQVIAVSEDGGVVEGRLV